MIKNFQFYFLEVFISIIAFLPQIFHCGKHVRQMRIARLWEEHDQQNIICQCFGHSGRRLHPVRLAEGIPVVP